MNQIENLSIATEILILAGILINITLTSVLAKTTLEKIITLAIGSFVWGYGLWMRIKLRKAMQELKE